MLARIVHGMGGGKESMDRLIDQLVPFLHKEGITDERIKKEMHRFIECYCTVMYEERVKEILGEKTVH